MGLRINADIETSSGPTNAVYIRVDGFKWSKLSNEISFTTSAWLSKDESDAFRKIHADDKSPNAVGILSPLVTLYDSEESLGREINIENFFKFVPTFKDVVETPIFEEKEVSEEIPYVSFDSEGEEITLYRTKVSTQKVQIGSETVEKVFLDTNAINNPIGYCYKELKARLSSIIPANLIEII